MKNELVISLVGALILSAFIILIYFIYLENSPNVNRLIIDGILLFVGFFAMIALAQFFFGWLESKCNAIIRNSTIKILVKNLISAFTFFVWAYISTQFINVILKKYMEFNRAGITGIFIYVFIVIVAVCIPLFLERHKTRRSH
ncbi:hypothetical protein [Methylomonas albis]|uniref:Intracellular septation protein A n=1 Tax=Methylomonas albis TaxID=1854563 RepID=A0ABR9CZL1_9GAMM|nr:hypothetical protein [Methylomonas albis]MBD9356307.1 hypothetical protein [Methylomonas albis]